MLVSHAALQVTFQQKPDLSVFIPIGFSINEDMVLALTMPDFPDR